MLVESRVHPIACEQFIMRALLNQLPTINDVNLVGRTNRAEPMGDNDDRTPFADLGHISLDDRFGLVVQGARRFVEDENPGVRH